jgi:hypothetical protein
MAARPSPAAIRSARTACVPPLSSVTMFCRRLFRPMHLTTGLRLSARPARARSMRPRALSSGCWKPGAECDRGSARSVVGIAGQRRRHSTRHPAIVFGGRHADVPITAESGSALGRLIAAEALVCVVDLSELGSNAARRRFMAAFAEALSEANKEPLHLILDEADLWAPQRPLPDQTGLLGHIEEIVRRGRVRGFIPWLITQRSCTRTCCRRPIS